jgi:hypothetical protein
VDSRSDTLIHKARISIQIQPFGRQTAWSGCVFNRYGNCVFNFNHSDACLSWSGRALNKYGNCVLKINRPDGHPPWFGRTNALYGNYLQRTYDRPDDSASPSGRGSQTGKIFRENLKNYVAQLSVWTASVHIMAVAHLNPQPINRGPWALRTVRIWF